MAQERIRWSTATVESPQYWLLAELLTNSGLDLPVTLTG
jgi:hypothetical protein